MISAPYFDTQTRNTLPSGFRFESFGDNRQGFVIEASSDSDVRCLTQRICVPQGETRSIRGSYLVTSSVEASSNGYEGIAQDVQTFVRDGTSKTPKLTYHNDPWKSGDPDLLITDKFESFTQINFIDQIPYDVASEFVSVSIGARGYQGELKINSALLTNHYADHFVTKSSASNWSNFTRQSSTLIDGRIPETWNRYIDAYTVRVAENQDMRMSISGYIDSAIVRNFNGGSVSFFIFFVLKMRRTKDQGSDFKYFLIQSEREDGAQVLGAPVNYDLTFTAESGYDQIEPMMSVYPLTSRDQIALINVNHSGLRFDVHVGDVTGTGS